MNILTSRLFAIPDEPRHWHSIIAWWELRRIPYNLIILVIGSIGLFVFGLLYYCYLRAQPEHDDWVPLLSAMVGVFGANFFYTGGWISELIARALWRERARYYGPILFSLGLLFSCAVCFLPSVLLGISWVVSVVSSGHRGA